MLLLAVVVATLHFRHLGADEYSHKSYNIIADCVTEHYGSASEPVIYECSTQGQFYECVNQSSTIKIRSKLDPVVTQLGGLLDKYCRFAENVTETTEFWNNVTEFAQDWKAQRSECGDAAEDVEGFCKWASECILDTALGRAKKDLPLDAVSYNVDLIKLSYAAKWRDFPETLPRSCNVLFLRYDDATGSPWSTASTDEPPSPADTLLISRFTLFVLLILGRLLEL